MIRIEGLRKRYPTATGPAVENLFLHVPERTFFTLLGPSGCGKSSTLRCIAGLERPDAGEIVIGGEVAFSHRRRVNLPPHRRAVSMVFQSYAVWPHMTVYGNVAYPLRTVRRSRAEVDEAVRRVLRLVGLERLAERPAPLLSGGEQQRVALARALVDRPRVLLLDEPLSNLDAKLREGMRIELRELQQALGFTAVYVTHDQEEAFALSDVMAVMAHGRIVELGAPEQIYQTPASAFGAEFLGAATRLAGTVARAEAAGVVHVTTALGLLACRAQAPPLPGERVHVYVRPEEVGLVDARSESAGLVLKARVERVSFMGGVLDWTAEVDDVRLRARALAGTVESAALRESVGKTVSVVITGARCVAAVEGSPPSPGDGAR